MAQTLAAAWLVKHGQGSMNPEHHEELRSVLLRDFAAKGIADSVAAAAVRDEIDNFLKAGRVSDTNLSRLERRIMARAAGGSMSARSEHAYSVAASELSASGRRVLGEAPCTARKNLSPCAEETAVDMSTWSQVAKYSQKLEEVDKAKKREAERTQQHRMRDALQKQVAEKKRHENMFKDEEQRMFQQQEDELARWRENQDNQKEAAMNKVLQVKKLREEQISRSTQAREQEQKQKLVQDQQLLQKAKVDLDRENARLSQRKDETKLAQAKLASEWQSGKMSRGDSRQVRIDDELKKVKEYIDVLDTQEERKKKVIPKIRPQPLEAPPASKRRGEEIYFDDDMFKQLVQEKDRKAEEAERDKVERLKVAKQLTQDFLKQQVAEREMQRRSDRDNKGNQRQAAQAAVAEHLQSEKKRSEDLRSRNIQYRDELQKQIDLKKSLVRVTEDEMSLAEKAINRRLLQEANELQSRVPSTHPRIGSEP